jgi:NADP-dependent 3-hydroxy acid dehydrogenase YdfG
MEDFDKVMNINCRVVVLMNKLVIPYLAETKGNIVNVSSVAGLRAVRTCNILITNSE